MFSELLMQLGADSDIESAFERLVGRAAQFHACRQIIIDSGLEFRLKLIRSLGLIGDEIIDEQKLSMKTVIFNTDFNRAHKTLVA